MSHLFYVFSMFFWLLHNSTAKLLFAILWLYFVVTLPVVHMINSIVFSEQATSCVNSIVIHAYHCREYALKLRDILMSDGVISDEDSYYTVSDNVPFKSALLKYIASSLPTTVEKSKYGIGLISDFDLYHNMKTDKDMFSFLNKTKLTISDVTTITILKKNRTNQRQWLTRIRNNIISDFELPDTPHKVDVKNVKKKAKEEENHSRRST